LEIIAYLVRYLPDFSFKKIIMQELIDKLKSEVGLTDDQAKKAIETIKNFVVDKFPMLEGAIGNLFGNA
jgi:hypothetical protein